MKFIFSERVFELRQTQHRLIEQVLELKPYQSCETEPK